MYLKLGNPLTFRSLKKIFIAQKNKIFQNYEKNSIFPCSIKYSYRKKRMYEFSSHVEL